MSTLSTANIQTKAAATPPVIKDVNGAEVAQFCTAWVNFIGSASPVTIRDSFNVGAVTDSAVGNYTVTYTTAMANANYAAVATMGGGSVANAFSEATNVQSFTTTNTQILLGCDGTGGATYTAQDADTVCFVVMGGK